MCIRDRYSDTFSSNVTSTRGNNKTQGFVCGDAYYVMHYPMKSESHAAQGLKDFVHRIGIPAQAHTDNAKVETLSEWKDFLRKHWIKVVTEPYTPNQNKCEHEFGCVRIHAHTDGANSKPRTAMGLCHRICLLCAEQDGSESAW